MSFTDVRCSERRSKDPGTEERSKEEGQICMKDKEGFLVRCEYSEWQIIDARDNKDYVCLKFPTYNYSAHQCHADEQCRYYEPDIREGTKE